MSGNGDNMSGLQSGLRGDLIAPSSAEGMAGYLAGSAIRNGGGTAGSMEWILAPIVLAPVFACLYPLTTAATLATAYAVAAVIDATRIASGGVGLALALLPAIVVCWIVGRLDQRLGEIAAYRWARHAVRLVIVVLLANAAALNAGTPVGVEPRHIDGIAGFFEAMVTMPNVMPVVLALVCAQFYLVRDGSGRRYWNYKLIQWRFRPKGFRSRFPRTKTSVFTPTPAAPVPVGIQRHLDAAAAKRRPNS